MMYGIHRSFILWGFMNPFAYKRKLVASYVSPIGSNAIVCTSCGS